MDLQEARDAFTTERKRHVDVWPVSLMGAAIRLELSLRARIAYPDNAAMKRLLAEDFSTFEAALAASRPRVDTPMKSTL